MTPLAVILAALAGLSAPPPSLPPEVQKARAALRNKDVKRAHALLAPRMEDADPRVRAAVRELAGEVALAAKHPEDALAQWKEARAALDEANAPEIQVARLNQRLAALAAKSKDTATLKELEALQQADRAVLAAERWPLLPSPEDAAFPSLAHLEGAQQGYQDARLSRRLAHLRPFLALGRGVAGKQDAVEEDLQAARGSCEKGGIPDAACQLDTLRLESRVRVLLARADRSHRDGLEAAVRAANLADTLDPAVRGNPAPYTRSAFTSTVCAAVDALAGPDACRRLEDDAGIRPTFRDLSREAPLPALNDEAVKRTHAEYLFLLNRCLRGAARKDEGILGVRWELTWVVQPSGLANELGVEPRRYREHMAAACFHKALKVFRYPPYTSQERKVVALALQVNG